MWICDGLVSVRRTWFASKKNVSRGERAECVGPKASLSKLYSTRLDLAVVAHLVAEAEERVLDGAADLRDRVQVAERELLAGERDVDHLVAEAALELLVGERARRAPRRPPRAAGGCRSGAPRSAGRGRRGAPARARSCGRGRARATRLSSAAARRGLVLAIVLGSARRRSVDVVSSPSSAITKRQHTRVSAYDEIARIYDPWSRTVVEDVAFYVEEARRSGGPVVELGVGTGRIAVPIALAGDRRDRRRLVARGCSPSRASAPLRAGVELDLRFGDLRSPPVEGEFPLVIAPFRSLLHMETDDDRRAALRAVHELLVPGGRFVFDVFAPAPDDIAETHGRWLQREPGIFERAEWDEERQTLILRVRGEGAEAELSLAWLTVAEWTRAAPRGGLPVERPLRLVRPHALAGPRGLDLGLLETR